MTYRRPQRSILSVPGSSQRFLQKAQATTADAIIFDLEDSVTPPQRPVARGNIIDALQLGTWGTKLLTVRVNPTTSPDFYQDLIAVVEGAGQRIDGIVLPKVERPEDVYLLTTLLAQIEAHAGIRPDHPDDAFRIRIELQIETARGMEQAHAIAAASPRVASLIFGPGDFAASLGMPVLSIGTTAGGLAGPIWQGYLSRMLVAARAAGVAAIDGPYAKIGDTAGLRASGDLSRLLGYDGKWAIHPDQIDMINELFTPSATEIEGARAIVAADAAAQRAGHGAFRTGREMLDRASVAMAERLLLRAGQQAA